MNSLGLAAALFLSVAQTNPATPPADSAAPRASTPEATAAWDHLNNEGQKIATDLQSRDLPGLKALVPSAQADVAAFVSKYPGDPNNPSARLVAVQLGTLARELQLPGAPTADQTSQQLGALAADTTLPMSIRAQGSLMQTAQIMQAAQASKDPAAWADVDARIDAFEKTFGDISLNGKQPALLSIRQAQIEIEKMTSDKAHYDALLSQLAKDSHPEIALLAKQAQTDEKQMAELKTKPLDLHFTALDGSAVDLSKLRGKVVLVDFWATWCGPCVGETPHVVAAYKKYHDKGFEILGISLDQDKAALQKYITDNKMPWPQYFDGKGWENEISSHFGIQSIPAMWLVGKDGVLVTQDGRDDLDAQIGKLLGAK